MIGVQIAELIISGLALLFVIPQIYLIRKQLQAQHEQAQKQHEEHRRETTIKVMDTWNNCLKKEFSIAEEIVRHLSEEDCRKLHEHKPFDVKNNVKTDICNKFCPLDKECCGTCSLNTSNTVQGEIHKEIRYNAICYLNMLETVITAWHLGIVDKEMIEKEFEFLTHDKMGMALQNFRNAIGGKGYPLMDRFLTHLKNPNPESPRNPL